MTTTKNEVQAVAERNVARASYKNAHCRPIFNNGKGFMISYIDENKNMQILGYHQTSRAGAWKDAAAGIGKKMVKKLES